MAELGKVTWVDLTVEDAPAIRDFYQQVIGWSPSPLQMSGGYDDYNMIPPGGTEAAAGVCHARGNNAKLPPRWLVYVGVKDLAASVAAVERLGGRATMHSKNYWLIEDPAGAAMMIYQGE